MQLTGYMHFMQTSCMAPFFDVIFYDLVFKEIIQNMEIAEEA